MTSMSPTPPDWTESRRYPDPAIRALDPSFSSLVWALSSVERLYTGCRWAEGPVWFGDGRYVLWSDIPNNRILKWEEETGAVSVFRKPSDYANGHTRDRQGRLVSCEHGTRRVTRTEWDGRVTVLADRYQGRRLNSPNDVVVAPDGGIWFTDPSFGIRGDYEGFRAEPELPTNVYRLDPHTGVLACVTDEVDLPNGLAFSPDGSVLYVVECGGGRKILAFDVQGTRLANRRTFYACGAEETPDGFRVDMHGNLWCGWGMGGPGLDGVLVLNGAGARIGFIELPERCANVCFGGRARNRLFMAASHGLYSLYVNTAGTPYA
jgi:gluconolactonase